MYYGSGTVDSPLTHRSVRAPLAAAITLLKLEVTSIPNSEIDACLPEKYSCQVSPRSGLKWRSLWQFWRASPQQE